LQEHRDQQGTCAALGLSNQPVRSAHPNALAAERPNRATDSAPRIGIGTTTPRASLRKSGRAARENSTRSAFTEGRVNAPQCVPSSRTEALKSHQVAAGQGQEWTTPSEARSSPRQNNHSRALVEHLAPLVAKQGVS
jgi:hypothetical protein